MDTQKTQQSVISAASSEPLVGVTIGERYRILEKVGSGGLSDVYKACDVSSVRTVALKIIRINKETSKTGFELFASNARLNVQHPNLVSIYECGLTPEGEPWLALEWLEGRTLADLLREEGTLSLDTTVQMFEQIADALGYAHGKGEVHINLKPSNIMIVQHDGKPFVKICDFGYAKLLMERELEMADERAPARGSALYMSPEQFKGTRIDSRSDVYALACITYECLFGRPPHQGVDLLETMDRHMHVPVSFPSEPETSEALQAVLVKMLAKDLVHRYRTLSDAVADLHRALRGDMPKEEILPLATDANAVDFITSKRGSAIPKGREPWMLLMGCMTFLLFVLIVQQCMLIAQESGVHRVVKHDKKVLQPQYLPNGHGFN